jgi:hypothetical protein
LGRKSSVLGIFFVYFCIFFEDGGYGEGMVRVSVLEVWIGDKKSTIMECGWCLS